MRSRGIGEDYEFIASKLKNLHQPTYSNNNNNAVLHKFQVISKALFIGNSFVCPFLISIAVIRQKYFKDWTCVIIFLKYFFGFVPKKAEKNYYLQEVMADSQLL